MSVCERVFVQCCFVIHICVSDDAVDDASADL